MVAIFMFIIAAVVATVSNAGDWVTALTPFFVWLVTYIINKYVPINFSGWQIVYLLVPGVSLVTAWLTTLAQTNTNFWIQLVAGLLAIVLSQFGKQVTPTKIAADKNTLV